MHLKFDYSKALNFFNEQEVKNMEGYVKVAHDQLHNKTGIGSDFLGWVDLPTNYDKEEFARIKEASKKIQGNSEVLVVIGIGGSYLGARAAIEMLNDSFYNFYEKDRNVYKQQKSLIKSSDEWDFKTETAGFVYGEFDSKKLFSMPKNPSFIKMLLKMFGNNSATVLDFFAGSATTADAVMQLNAEDGGNRCYIMVQLDQPTFTTNSDGTESPAKGAEAAYKDGYRYIDQISRERIKRARAKILEINPSFPNFDGGFKHYQVVKPDQKLLEDLDTYDIETGTFMDGSGQINLIGEDYFDDMLTPFSADYLGVEGGALAHETILTTWKLSDGYAVDKKEKHLDFAGYPAIQLDNRLYLIEQGWTEEQTKVLVNLLGRRELEVQTIILYGYSFEMTALRELELALSSLDKVVKLIKNY